MQNVSNDTVKNDEIDVIQLLSVLFKRKWIIITITFVGFIISFFYFNYIKKESYKTQINIFLPESLYVSEDYLLAPGQTDLEPFMKQLRNELYLQMENKNNTYDRLSYTLDISTYTDNLQSDQIRKSILITLIGNKDKINKAIKLLYKNYSKFKETVLNKNKYLTEITRQAFENSLSNKIKLLDTLKSINTEGKYKINALANGENIFYTINEINNEIITITKNIKLNKAVEFFEGDFLLLQGNQKTSMDILIKENTGSLAKYIKPVQSKKKKDFIIIAFTILFFLVAILAAFIVEFFSREEVKQRLFLKQENKK